MSAPHSCPGRCGAQVARMRFACRTCWYRLPAALRNAINATYRSNTRTPAHTAAMRDAIDWYRANPPEVKP